MPPAGAEGLTRMARLTDITGAQTDNVLLRELRRPVFVIKPNGFPLGSGEAVTDLECLRTGEVTHSIVRLAGERQGHAIPAAWIYDARNVVPFTPPRRSARHVA